MCYDDAVVWILKFSVSPRLTLMEVANPWMVVSPTPVTCQCCGIARLSCSHRRSRWSPAGRTGWRRQLAAR